MICFNSGVLHEVTCHFLFRMFKWLLYAFCSDVFWPGVGSCFVAQASLEIPDSILPTSAS